MARERTLVLCKPDSVQRSLVGPIIARLEAKGLRIVALKMLGIRPALARQHYEAHVQKPFYADLEAFITSSPVVAMVLEGDQAVEIVRRLMGPTDSVQAPPGTIRGDYGISLTKNLVHGSDSLASAQREISLFFTEDELYDYTLSTEGWV
jgi:nucleoside-diphosphate kinase